MASVDALHIAPQLGDGRRIVAGGQPTGATATAPIMVAGAQLGTVTVSTANGSLLSPEEERLGRSLGQLHVVAALVATVAARVVGLVLAQTLSQPLRRIRSGAERLERGQLETGSRSAPSRRCAPWPVHSTG